MNNLPTIKFLGVGGAFAPLSKGHSNMLITSNDQHMLVDCGGALQFNLKSDFGLTPSDIDAIWISHLHADHIGALEWFAFHRHFLPNKDAMGNTVKPKLFMVGYLMDELWETALKGGLQSVGNIRMELSDYFDCVRINESQTFFWQGFSIKPVRTLHTLQSSSFGLFLRNQISGKTTLVTTDASFYPQLMAPFYNIADQIFHDTETLLSKSGVHAHYSELHTLPDTTKSKIWMYHYADMVPTFKEDGFQGFVTKGQTFAL